MTKVYDAEQVRARLTERITADGYKSVADAFGCTESYLRMVSSGDRTPGPAILAGLGMQKVYADDPKRRAAIAKAKAGP